MKALKALAVVIVSAAALFFVFTTFVGSPEQSGTSKQDRDFAAWKESSESNRKKAALADRISKCEAWIGMSESELDASWGSPSKTNVTTTRVGERSQRIYRHLINGQLVKIGSRCDPESLPERAYVYVENGVVTAIQARQ